MKTKSATGLCRVVTYNILADGYATSGLHDSYCSTTHLSWEYRSKRILAEIKLYDADILGLQEVEERFAVGELKTFLETRLGYQVLYAREEEELCGVVLAFKSQRFECIHSETIVYGKSCDSSLCFLEESERVGKGPGAGVGCIVACLEECRERREIAILALLREQQSNRLLFVAVTHLFWDPEYPDVKMVQAATLCAESKRFLISSITAMNEAKDVDISMIPSILMGDFNSLPDYNRPGRSASQQQGEQYQQHSSIASGVYDLLLAIHGSLTGENDLERHPHHPFNWRKSRTDNSNPTTTTPANDINACMCHKLSCHGFHLASGMKTCLGREPDATTCTPWFTGCLDYVFYTPRLLTCEEYLEIPKVILRTTNTSTIDGDASTKMQCTMPNDVCPSDHLAVGCGFRFVVLQGSHE